ncbi:hypothetical protein Q5P01_010640 [Channa striata]|uniref:Dynein axonemal intermediate chain 4 n=1 Tax=Channa striata TaxID=64152 RepID=A0AA88MRR4_CHASR|nr:hypothetical protein Q5P01_010640 [Channa striata]
MAAQDGARRRHVLRPSSRETSRSVPVSGPSTRRRTSVMGSTSWRRFSLCGGGSRLLFPEKSSAPSPKPPVRVLDEEDNDVTPQPLYQADPEPVQVKTSRMFVDEMSAGISSEPSAVTGSFNMPFSSVLGSSRISSQSTLESLNKEIEETFYKRDVPVTFPDASRKRGAVSEKVTEEMLQEFTDIYITETDDISLLDMPSTSVSVDADQATAVVERNGQYVELCKNRMGNDKYVDRCMQTFNGAAKTKEIQSSSVILVNKGMTVTSWDIYDTFCGAEQDETGRIPEPEKADYCEDASRSAERSVSVCSTASSASTTSSMKELEGPVSLFTAESSLQLIMQSEKFQHCLLVIERSILGNMFQPKLAAYRQLPVLEDPDSPAKPVATEQRTEDAESRESPALERLWAFTCELSRGRSVTSMAWNKKNPDLLAVGYGEFDCGNQKPGLVCCWSIKNLKWPERVFHCDSAVTALDFSANNPRQLAVGMHDGNIAIYNVSQDKSHSINSRECPHKHLGPVWQLRWTPQEMGLTGERVESLFSVSEDGRISKWFFISNGLDCIDLMKLNTKKKRGKSNTAKKTESVLPALTPGLCFDFHPINSNLYLVGTGEGFIHKSSCSNSQQFLETYRKHFGPVNCIAWCPLSPDVFMSCSSDWTMQLWKQDQLDPILSFASTQMAVCDMKWSPKWATVFGAVYEEQLEIWDLNSNIMDPVIVQPAAPGVKMTTLLFATQTDAVLVGDSDGQLTVYQLKNLRVGESSQVDILEGLISSAASTS